MQTVDTSMHLRTGPVTLLYRLWYAAVAVHPLSHLLLLRNLPTLAASKQTRRPSPCLTAPFAGGAGPY